MLFQKSPKFAEKTLLFTCINDICQQKTHARVDLNSSFDAPRVAFHNDIARVTVRFFWRESRFFEGCSSVQTDDTQPMFHFFSSFYCLCILYTFLPPLAMICLHTCFFFS